ncbi:MAG TPA: hemerythrin domain-containing protein, partial [Vulgatibacter sp.]
GLLVRVLLVYEAALRRIDAGQMDSPALVTGSAGIVRHFIEDYHEKLEEGFLFPRFERAGTLVDLVTTLREQHQAGRRVTDRILELSTPDAFGDPSARQELMVQVRRFIRMYRPHAAREDTVLFPAFRELVSQQEYKDLGERFESIEHERFGAAGFEGVLAQVVRLEREAGIADLAQFTPA